MVRRLFLGWWQDDAGALVSLEFLFLGTLLVLGAIVGMTNMRDAVNVKLSGTGNALLALNQGYCIAGQEGLCACTEGSEAIDMPETLPPTKIVPPANPAVINVPACQN